MRLRIIAVLLVITSAAYAWTYARQDEAQALAAPTSEGTPQ